jgi:endoglucanase
MHKKIVKAVTASLMAASMLSTTVATVVPMTVSAGQVLGETKFEYKALPWHTCESQPAKQTFRIEDDAFHVKVLVPEGAEKSKWDLQVRHRGLNFTKGHKYEVRFKAKAKRDGMELCSKIGNTKGDREYFELDGNKGEMHDGPHNCPEGQEIGANWGNAVKLSTEYKEFKGIFTPYDSYKNCEWAFHYAKDSNGYGGNAQEGDEIWFDEMSIIDLDGSDTDWPESNHMGAISRDYSGLKNNYISVNQVGYFPNLQKIATLGDNSGDIIHGASKINIGSSPLDFEVCDASSGAAVYTGKTQPMSGTDKDSGDNVHKIDFSEFKTEGKYYIKVGEWRSFDFNIGKNIYTDPSHNMLTNALNYFYQNRSGIDIKTDYITSGDKSTLAHEGGHKTDSASVQKEWVDSYKDQNEATGTYASSKITANGGWYDAGDHGKYVVNGGISVWTLQNMFERALKTEEGKKKFAAGSDLMKVPENTNNIPDILDECIYELDFMKQMVVKSDEPTWGKYAGLVYHKLHDHKWTGLATRPYDYETEWKTVRIVKPPTFAATLNFVACAAQAARLLEPYAPEKAAEYLEAAKTSYKAFKDNFYEYTTAEATNKTSLYAPLDQSRGGGAYGDTEVKDDAYWAACELFATTKDSAYYEDLQKYKDAFNITARVSGGENNDTYSAFNWGNTGCMGSLTLLVNEDNLKGKLDPAAVEKINSSLTKAADSYLETEKKQGYGIPYLYDGPGYTDSVNLTPDIVIKGYEWGSNSMVINNAMLMAYAYDQTKDIKYMNGVTSAMDYLFGNNPLSFSFISGYGSYKLQNPHHRYWSHELDETLPMAPDGVLSGGPNAGLQDPYVRALGFVPGNDSNPSQRCYVDSIEAWSTNEVTINWNSPLAWMVSFLQDEAPKAGNGTDPSQPTTKPSDNQPTTTPTDNQPTTKPSDDQPTTSPIDPAGKFIYGDVDLNGTVELADVTRLGKFLVNKTAFPLGNGTAETEAKAMEQADVKYDKVVDAVDLSGLIEYNLGKKALEDLGPVR